MDGYNRENRGTVEQQVKTAAKGGKRKSAKGKRSAKTSFSKGGLTFERIFCPDERHPFDTIEWDLREASITNEKGEVIFKQENVEVPKFWSQLATNVVVSKYFRGNVGTPERERSVKQLISRVADTITEWGKKDGYFASEVDAENFRHELTHMLVYQVASFNSPVWFNCGIEPHPQCSACFINSVEDSMSSILELAKTEGMLFKGGSGTGTNFSVLRSSKEPLRGGGIASGPVSFMKGYDAFAGVIKSGGKTRRAAKMVILNIDHPDIVEFIECKAKEEKKAWALIAQGYDHSLNGEAYSSIFFQNANNSVRVTDDFMKAVLEDGEWQTRAVTDGRPMEKYKARELLDKIAHATWICGDPGMQFDTTINKWHTCKNTDRIHASNPCSEYMFLNDSACNLASLNLMKFRTEDGGFDVERFKHAVRVMITAQEIIVDNASYPTPKIARNSYDYRPLGLGYANLGALLMSMGLPYDSDAGRSVAAAVTAVMTGEAYVQSALIAQYKGPFAGFEKNREPMLDVIRMHNEAVSKIDSTLAPHDLLKAASESWRLALERGLNFGYRNAQVTVLAPTGTIAFMMDCDTTGIEPDISLIKYKKLVGGGLLKIVNNTVPIALKKLGYSETEIKDIVDYIDEVETIEGAPHLKPEHLAVFDCAFRPKNGKRFIHYMGHIKMMAAVQPFLSGAISKTVNVPEDTTPAEIADIYVEAWKQGLKAIAIYRDNCKKVQPLATSTEVEKPGAARKPYRRRLPDERKAITHKFNIAGHEGYITVGMFEDGTPGEIFIVMAKEGSVISGLMDSFATAISLALQYGVPLKVLVDKFSHTRFEPSGITTNRQIPMAKSIMDYIFRWLASKFLPPEDQAGIGAAKTLTNGVDSEKHEGTDEKEKESGKQLKFVEKEDFSVVMDSPPCPECGAIMVRNGACYKCMNCGATSGCS